MDPRSILNLLPCIFFVLYLTPFLTNAHSLYTQLPYALSPESHTHSLPPLTFLINLLGTRKGDRAEGLFKLKKYLVRLGYMKSATDSNIFDNNLELALRRYQNFFNLNPSGVLDQTTIQNMLTPRCGVPDFVANPFEDNNEIYYTYLPTKWPAGKRVLTYSFKEGTPDTLVHPIANATAQWASVSNFEFKYIEDYKNADVKISYEHGDHGDGGPFDGPGGVVAHSFGANDGRLHYDEEEKWIDGTAPRHFDLQTVGLHELGHVLGLGHSRDANSVMYATIQPNTRKDLTKDDIVGVIDLYRQ